VVYSNITNSTLKLTLVYAAAVTHNITVVCSISYNSELLTLNELDFCTFFPNFCRRAKTGVKIWLKLILEPFVYSLCTRASNSIQILHAKLIHMCSKCLLMQI